MTFGEALAVLGIDARTDSRSARRAYLRKVKEHKPERDPDGFQRVRTAWELVEPRLPTATAPEVREPVRAPRPLPVHRAPVAEPEPEPVVVPEPVVEPEPEPEPEPEGVPEWEPDALPRDTLIPPDAVDEPVPWEVSEAPDLSAFLLREPLGPPPNEPPSVPDPVPWDAAPSDADADARPWTVEPFEPPEAEPVGSPAEALGFQPRPAGPTPVALVDEAREQAEIDAPRALDALTRGLKASLEGQTPEPDIRAAVHVVLALHRSGAAHEARGAWAIVRDWIDGTGAGTRVAGTVVAWLALCRELSDLPVRFPPAVRRRLADAILDMDLATANNDLLELYRAQPHIALNAAELLEAHAPNLHKLYGASLRDPAGNQTGSAAPDAEPPPARGSGIGLSMLVYVGLLVASIALRVCIADSPPRPYDFGGVPGVVPLNLEPWDPGIQFDPVQYAIPGVPVLAVRLLCIEGGAHPAQACDAARTASEAVLAPGATVDAGSCATAVEALESASDLRGSLSENELLDTQSLLRQIKARVDAVCPPPEEPPVAP